MAQHGCARSHDLNETVSYRGYTRARDLNKFTFVYKDELKCGMLNSDG